MARREEMRPVERPRRRRLGHGPCGLLLAMLALAGLAAAADATPPPGSLDAGFGRAGRALLPVSLGNPAVGSMGSRGWLSTPVSTAAMPGGGVVVAGERTVAALDRDGKVDRRFGSGGRVALPAAAGERISIEDVAVDADGHIFVLASARFAAGGKAMVVELSRAGGFESSFGGDGVLLTDFGLPAPETGPYGPAGAPTAVLPSDLAIDERGRLVIAGTTVAAIAPCRGAGEQPHHSVFVARLLPGGELDGSFGKGGVALDQRQPFYVEQHPFLGGIALYEGAIFYATDQNDAAGCEGFGGGLLARLDESGARDQGFGKGGLAEITPSDSRPRQIAVDRRGRILILRDATSSEAEYRTGFGLVSRWNADGTLDTGFGDDGEQALKLPGEGTVDALAVDARGRPLLGGGVAPRRPRSAAKRPSFLPLRFVLIRLTPQGRPDRSFGRGGRVLTRFPDHARARASDLAVRGGRAVLAGPVQSSALAPGRGFALARYRLGP